MNFRSDASSGRSLASRFRDLKMIPCSWEIHPSCARHENENICFVKQKNPVSLMSICVLYRRDPYSFVLQRPLPILYFLFVHQSPFATKFQVGFPFHPAMA